MWMSFNKYLNWKKEQRTLKHTRRENYELSHIHIHTQTSKRKRNPKKINININIKQRDKVISKEAASSNGHWKIN